jgi:hypothetical protein
MPYKKVWLIYDFNCFLLVQVPHIYNEHRLKGLNSYTVKKVSQFPIPSLNYSRPRRVWLVTSRLGTAKWLTFFTVYFSTVNVVQKKC